MHRFWQIVPAVAAMAAAALFMAGPAHSQQQSPHPPPPPVAIIMGVDKGLAEEERRLPSPVAPGAAVLVRVELDNTIYVPDGQSVTVVLSLVALYDGAIVPLGKVLANPQAVRVLVFQSVKDARPAPIVFKLPILPQAAAGAQLLIQAVLANDPNVGRNIQRTALLRVTRQKTP